MTLLAPLKKIAGRIANRLLTNAEFSALHEIRHLKKLLDHMHIDCVFDVGANSGQYATMLRKRVGYNGLIISFEPNPELIDDLHRRSEHDALWIIKDIALSNTDEPQTFNIMIEDQFSSFKSPSTAEYSGLSHLNHIKEVSTVQCHQLDTIFDELKREHKFQRPFLKMDTQGNDLAVLAGAKKSLAEICGLQSELGFKRLYKDMPLFNEALDAYSCAGFELSALVPNNAGHFPVLLEMDCIMINKTRLMNGSSNVQRL